MSYKFDAVIFDLDGVITKTALVHAAAWKKMFDDYLQSREVRFGESFREFTHEHDYLPFVDGKPRYKGVESFLNSRNIEIPFGNPSDDPEMETICGLGNKKNMAFNEVLDAEGVEVYPSTVELMNRLIAEGIKVGVASSSKNCEAVLEKTGLINKVETRVDGVVSAELGLEGKPEPDIFTTAADNLGVTYDKAVVIEDAVSGVQAGAKGNFGFVLGIAREGNAKELQTNGADIVVDDIDEIRFEGIVDWFESKLADDQWSITYHDYVPEKEKTRETLLTTGNGYIGVRGAMEETKSGEFNYPGTYMAGLYNRLVSKVGERDVENEDFVNCPNGFGLDIKIGNRDWIDLNHQVQILSIKRKLDFRTGQLCRMMVFEDALGNRVQLESKRFASMKDPHLGAMMYTLIPLNFSSKIHLRSAINGNIINDGVARYRQLNQKHLEPAGEGNEGNISWLKVKTIQSDVEVVIAADHKISGGSNNGFSCNIGREEIAMNAGFDGEEGTPITIEKNIAIFSSQNWDSANPKQDALDLLQENKTYDKLLAESKLAWDEIWQRVDISVEGDRLAQKLLRLHTYHLMVSLSPHAANNDVSITARGLHGEAYRGHIFWDELFILPLFNVHYPEVTKATLRYRYNRLDAARNYAKEYGYAGAMYPWQSGSDGREETQVVHLNPVTGKWGPDFSSYQRHVSLAIAYNTWQYFHTTNDLEFMEDYGAEMFLEICRFWASKAKMKENGRYSIENVMGPDEFHEKYPGAKEGGLKDNTYTNLMVVWSFDKAIEILEKLPKEKVSKLKDKIALKEEELSLWAEIASNLNIVINDDILSQYDGYFDLEELDWDYYRNKYGNIYRMDRILKAEGKSADDFKVAKQADTLQTFYNLNEETVTKVLEELGYDLSEDYLEKNLQYYLARTSHGSTLSRVVHAQLANIVDDQQLSWSLYKDALTSDFADIQGGTTGEGIHAGVMAGTILIAMQSFAGVDLRGQVVKITPKLPKHWRSINFNFNFKTEKYYISVAKDQVELRIESSTKKEVSVEVNGKLNSLLIDQTTKISL